MDGEDKKQDEKRPSEERGSTEASRPNVAEEYLNNWKRERADFLNYKKDESRRIEEFARFASEAVILEVLEIVDDLEIAAREVQNIGLEGIIKKFHGLFKKYAVEKILVAGTSFNPELHEAVETEVGGTKIVEVRSGYTMHGRVIRPARVKIIN